MGANAKYLDDVVIDGDIVLNDSIIEVLNGERLRTLSVLRVLGNRIAVVVYQEQGRFEDATEPACVVLTLDYALGIGMDAKWHNGGR